MSANHDRHQRKHSDVVTPWAILAILMAANILLSTVLPSWAYVPALLAAAALALLVASTGGAPLEYLGLARAHFRGSLLVGLGIAGVIVAAVFAGLAIPVVREIFIDDRAADLSAGALAYQALVRIPLGTAVGEELLFRSAVFGVGLRRWSRTAAIVGSSALFGLWHILPALESHSTNSVASGVPVLVVVVGTVGITGLAGAGFSWLRLRTGHVTAPIVVHAALNASALVAAVVAST